jgi:AbrB family looped-hinge helix DNA binding protein
MPRSRITSKGQITVPKEVRERLGVTPGDELEFAYEGERLEVRAVRRRRLDDFKGLFRMTRGLAFEQERARAWAAQTRRLRKGARDGGR